MNKQKLMYEAPTAQTFVVRFEGVICQSYGLDGLEKGNDRNGEDEGYFFN